MKVLSYIKSEVLAGRPFPGNTQIANFMGWKNGGSVKDVLTRLVCSGHLRRSSAAPGQGKRYFYEVIGI